MERGADAGTRDAELDRVREEFHRELMRKSMRIAELELMLEHTEREFASSFSWRITRPLRLLGYFRRRARATRPPG